MKLKTLQLEDLEVKSFVTNLETQSAVVRGGLESINHHTECGVNDDSDHEICTIDSCI